MNNPDNAAQLTEDARKSFNELFGNMFNFEEEDMAVYDECYKAVFSGGNNLSYMSTTFYAQFSAEILVGLLSSNPFRKFLVQELEKEEQRNEPGQYWNKTMPEKRFGIQGVDYKDDVADLLGMMQGSYTKIEALNEWFGTADGQKEFDMYCLSRKAIRDIKKIVCGYPYLVRRYDFEKEFANEIMEYAGIIAQQILQTTGE